MSEFLRKKARTLELLASGCFDPDTAQRLRQLADEFQTVADKNDMPDVPAPSIVQNGQENGGLDLQ